MTREIIAEIRLAPGEVGYYDDYSRIYLSTAKPTAKIYAGTNTSQIRKSIRSGRLRLVSGSLFAAAPAPKPEVKPAPVVEKPAVKPEPAFVADTVTDDVPKVRETETVTAEIIAEEPVAEAIQEEIAEEIAEEKPKRRRSRKKAEE